MNQNDPVSIEIERNFYTLWDYLDKINPRLGTPPSQRMCAVQWMRFRCRNKPGRKMTQYEMVKLMRLHPLSHRVQQQIGNV